MDEDKTLGFIASFHAEHGFYPTLQDVGNKFGITRATARVRVMKLAKDGKIAYLGDKRKRIAGHSAE